MNPFSMGATTITVTQPCLATTVTCAQTTACRPQGASLVALNKMPHELDALRRQLETLERAGFDHIGYVLDPADLHRAEELLKQLNL